MDLLVFNYGIKCREKNFNKPRLFIFPGYFTLSNIKIRNQKKSNPFVLILSSRLKFQYSPTFYGKTVTGHRQITQLLITYKG